MIGIIKRDVLFKFDFLRIKLELQAKCIKLHIYQSNPIILASSLLVSLENCFEMLTRDSHSLTPMTFGQTL